jgi:hypothetical protein
MMFQTATFSTTMPVVILLLLLLQLTGVRSWCNPADKGDCELIIRGGRNSNDENFRTIKFLNHAHKVSGMISVQPSTNVMSFSTGNKKLSRVSIDQNGVLNADHVRATTIDSETSNFTNTRISTLQSSKILANSTIFGNTNITKKLHVTGDTFLKEVSGTKLHVESIDGRSGLLIDPDGMLIYNDASSLGHIDFKSKMKDDTAVRVSAETDKLLLHGRRVIVTNRGHVGIGTEPTHVLHVNGIVRAASSTITTGSDRRVKKNIQSINKTEALNKISKLNVRHFQWHPSYKHTTKQESDRKIGFIAQELKQIIPEAVKENDGIEKYIDENGENELIIHQMHTVNMDPVIMNLISAVQALKEKVDVLERKVENCEK